MAQHIWIRNGDLLPVTVPGIDPPKSDIHFCSRCSQMIFSEIGGPPMEETNPFLQECDVSITQDVMET